MNAARLDRSERLRRVKQLLKDGREHSTMEIIDSARVCAVNSIISELRRNGCNIPPSQRREGVWYYRMRPGRWPGIESDAQAVAQ